MMQIVTRISTRVTPFLTLVRPWKAVFTMIQSRGSSGRLVASATRFPSSLGGITTLVSVRAVPLLEDASEGLLAGGSKCELAVLLKGTAIPTADRGQKLKARRA
jgi:hypothetical protein